MYVCVCLGGGGALHRVGVKIEDGEEEWAEWLMCGWRVRVCVVRSGYSHKPVG